MSPLSPAASVYNFWSLAGQRLYSLKRYKKGCFRVMIAYPAKYLTNDCTVSLPA